MTSLCRLSHRVALSASRISASTTMPITTDARVGPYNWVNGERCEPHHILRTTDNPEPRTGKLLCKVGVSGRDEVDRAVSAARKALPAWKAVSNIPIIVRFLDTNAKCIFS